MLSAAAAPPRTEASRLARLRHALDPAAMSETLRAHPLPGQEAGERFAACRVERLFPHGRGDFTLLYTVELAAGGARRELPLFAELPAEANLGDRVEILSQKLQKRRRRQLSKGVAASPFVALPEPGLVLRPPCLDERLEGLFLLHDPRALRRLLKQRAPELRPGREPPRVEVLGHRLFKRLTARLLFADAADGGRSVILKLYPARGGRGSRAAAAMEALRRAGLRVPRPLLFLEEVALLVMEDVPGRPPSAFPPAGTAEAARRAGAALRALHEAPPCTDTRHGVAEELRLLAGWVELTSEVLPELAAPLAAAWARAGRDLRGIGDTASPRLLHRDFYDKQVLLAADSATLIDLDTLALGDPALDVGNYLAHLHLRALQGVHAAGLEPAFLAGYADHDAGFMARVRVHAASARLRLACLHAFSSTSRHLAGPLLSPA